MTQTLEAPSVVAAPPADSKKLIGRRVLCFYPWTPFEETGAWSRYRCLWRFLLDQGAQVTLAFVGGTGTDLHLRNIAVSYGPNLNIIGAVWNLGQKLAATGERPELRNLSQAEISLLLMYEKTVYTVNDAATKWLTTLVASHDAVTCEYPMMLPTLSDFCRKAGKPLIATSHDALFELHGASPLGHSSLKQKEIDALRLADAVVFCTERERKLFEEFKIAGSVVMNTGDTHGVIQGEDKEARKAVIGAYGLKTANYVFFIGSAHGPNLEAVAEIKRLSRQVPEVTFLIAGNCSPKGIDGNIYSVGYVDSHTLDVMYRGANAVIVPLLRGTGSSVKTYDAFNYGKVVISTPVGIRGFAAEAEKEVILVEKPGDFPSAIRRVLGDAELRARIGQNARRYAEGLDYRIQFRPYADLINNLIGTPAPEASDVRVATRSLILVDNNLVNTVGHHYNYALSLRDQCRAMGVGFSALIKSEAVAEVLGELDGVPTFEQGIHDDAAQNPFPSEWGPLRGMYDFLGSNDHFARALEAGLRNRAATGDVVFLPNATPRQILGVALLLKKSPLYRMLKFVLLLRYSVNIAFGPIQARKTQLDKETAERYVFCFEKLFQVAPSGTVRLTTDSEELAKEYAALAKRPVEALPIPHTANEADSGPLAGLPTKNNSKLRIVFLGDARDEKGFELLPAVAKACAQEPRASRVELVFQAYVSSGYHSKMNEVILDLGKLKAPNLRLIESPLSAEAYQHLLASADLVLIPYDALTYRARTSGPFVEAVCAGKPVIIPAQSWMSTQLGNSGAGRTFLSGNAGDLVGAVVTAIQNHAALAEAAQELGKKFREFHNPENFVRRLMAE